MRGGRRELGKERQREGVNFGKKVPGQGGIGER